MYNMSLFLDFISISVFQQLKSEKVSLIHDMTHTWRLCSPLTRSRRSRMECDKDSLCIKASVNEEYLQAFRTKSYMEICNKAQLGRRTVSTKRTSSSILSSNNSSTTPPPSSIHVYKHLTDHLLEPRQEIISHMKQSLRMHHLLVEYFEASLEACHCCDTILEGVNSMRLSYRRITRVVKLSQRILDDNCDYDDQIQRQKDVIYTELSAFALQSNPLSIVSSSVRFRDIHDKYMELLHRLRLKRGKIRRKLTWKSVCKKVAGVALVTSHTAVLIALLVFSFHSIVGLVAAPSILCGLIGWLMKRKTKRSRMRRTRSCCSYDERLCEQLDVAAKGVYILINDLDTMSRMVKRLHDEVEHRRVIAEVCVRNGKCEILRQVVREFHDQHSTFLDQLEELEEHIYLCFLTINRSRTLVVQEIKEELVH